MPCHTTTSRLGPVAAVAAIIAIASMSTAAHSADSYSAMVLEATRDTRQAPSEQVPEQAPAISRDHAANPNEVRQQEAVEAARATAKHQDYLERSIAAPVATDSRTTISNTLYNREYLARAQAETQAANAEEPAKSKTASKRKASRRNR